MLCDAVTADQTVLCCCEGRSDAVLCCDGRSDAVLCCDGKSDAVLRSCGAVHRPAQPSPAQPSPQPATLPRQQRRRRQWRRRRRRRLAPRRRRRCKPLQATASHCKPRGPASALRQIALKPGIELSQRSGGVRRQGRAHLECMPPKRSVLRGWARDPLHPLET